MTRRYGVLILALSAVVVSHGTAQEVGLPLGETPAEAALEDLDGNAVVLQDVVGTRPAVVEFWATWCPVCEALTPTMERAYARFGDRVAFLVVAVGVNQSPRSIRRHLDNHPSPFPVLFDRRGRAVRAFQAPTTGYIAIVDGDGRVAYTGVGEDQDLEAALERVVGGM